MTRYARIREDISRLFSYTWASMKFLQHFTVKKTSIPLPAERLSYLYIQWVAYRHAIRKECFWIKSLFASKFRVYRGEIN